MVNSMAAGNMRRTQIIRDLTAGRTACSLEFCDDALRDESRPRIVILCDSHREQQILSMYKYITNSKFHPKYICR